MTTKTSTTRGQKKKKSEKRRRKKSRRKKERDDKPPTLRGLKSSRCLTASEKGTRSGAGHEVMSTFSSCFGKRSFLFFRFSLSLNCSMRLCVMSLCLCIIFCFCCRCLCCLSAFRSWDCKNVANGESKTRKRLSASELFQTCLSNFFCITFFVFVFVFVHHACRVFTDLFLYHTPFASSAGPHTMTSIVYKGIDLVSKFKPSLHESQFTEGKLTLSEVLFFFSFFLFRSPLSLLT